MTTWTTIHAAKITADDIKAAFAKLPVRPNLIRRIVLDPSMPAGAGLVPGADGHHIHHDAFARLTKDVPRGVASSYGSLFSIPIVGAG